MTELKKPLKVEFAPGCFDNFEGTQEELDELVAEITRLVESGELMEDESLEIDLDDLDSIELDTIAQALDEDDGDLPKRVLN